MIDLKRKVLSILMSFVLVATMLPTIARADDSNKCGDNLTWELDGVTGELTISGTGAMYDWDAQSPTDIAPWSEVRHEIKRVIIQGDVTNIGNAAFADCMNLISFTIPNSVTKIGNSAFYNCQNLGSIYIPANVKDLGSEAFRQTGCSNLTIDTGIENIGNYAFHSCEKLTKVIIPDSVKYLGTGVFNGCKQLKSATLSNKINSISNYMFYKCNSLSGITIPSNVKTIGECAFSACSELKDSITFPRGVTTIGKEAFSGDRKICKLIFKGSAPDIGTDAFKGITATAHRQIRNWSSDKMKNYGGTLTWQSCAETKKVTKQRVEPTCTKYGYTEEAVCTVCGKTLAVRTVIQKKPHTKVIDKAVKPTYTKTGKTEGSHCKACGKIFKKQKTIPRKKLTTPKISSLTTTSKGVTLKWKKITGATGYRVYRKAGTGAWKFYKTITKGSTTSYANTKLVNGTKYQYKVCATASLKGKVVNKSSFSTIKSTVWLKVSSLTSVKNVKGKKITAKWSKNTKATGYAIQYVTGKKVKTVLVKGMKNVQKTIGTFIKGKTYKVKIRAYKTVSGKKYYSAWSNVKSVKITK